MDTTAKILENYFCTGDPYLALKISNEYSELRTSVTNILAHFLICDQLREFRTEFWETLFDATNAISIFLMMQNIINKCLWQELKFQIYEHLCMWCGEWTKVSWSIHFHSTEYSKRINLHSYSESESDSKHWIAGIAVSGTILPTKTSRFWRKLPIQVEKKASPTKLIGASEQITTDKTHIWANWHDEDL